MNSQEDGAVRKLQYEPFQDARTKSQRRASSRSGPLATLFSVAARYDPTSNPSARTTSERTMSLPVPVFLPELSLDLPNLLPNDVPLPIPLPGSAIPNILAPPLGGPSRDGPSAASHLPLKSPWKVLPPLGLTSFDAPLVPFLPRVPTLPEVSLIPGMPNIPLLEQTLSEPGPLGVISEVAGELAPLNMVGLFTTGPAHIAKPISIKRIPKGILQQLDALVPLPGVPFPINAAVMIPVPVKYLTPPTLPHAAIPGFTMLNFVIHGLVGDVLWNKLPQEIRQLLAPLKGLTSRMLGFGSVIIRFWQVF